MIDRKLIRIAKKLIAENENNIEVTCFYDTDITYIDVKQNFDFYGKREYTLAVEKGLKSEDVFKVYDVASLVESYDSWTDHREESYNVLPFEKIKEIIKKTGNLEEINKNCEENFDYTDFENIDEFLEFIEGYDGETVIPLLNFESVYEIVEESRPYHYIPSFDKIAGNNYEDIGLQLKEGYESYVSRGYSQGDRLDVIYKTGSFTEIMIDHLLWDAPVYCRITINDDEYYIDEYMKDQYEYDKDEALEICKKIIPDFEKYQDEIEKALPEHPKYY